MRKVLIAAAVLSVVSIASAMAPAAAPAAATSVAAEAYWKCPSGYAFNVSGNAAQCKKAAYTDRRVLAGCLPGLFASADRIGTKDMCAGTNQLTGEISVERACKPDDLSAGYTKRIVSGTDFCGKAIPETVIAPNVMVTLSS